MRRFLIVAFGTAGDVNPFLALGNELRARGDEVVVFTSSQFERAVRLEGMEFESIGSREEYRANVANPNFWNPRKGSVAGLQAIAPLFPRIVEGVRKHLSPGRTAIVTSPFAYGSLAAREMFHLPTMALTLYPKYMRSVHSPPRRGFLDFPCWTGRAGARVSFRITDWLERRHLAPVINQHRRGLGLSEIRDPRAYAARVERIVCAWPEWFYPRQPDWPAAAETVGFLYNDGLPLGDGGATDWPPNPIVFTIGTGVSHACEFFKWASLAAHALGRSALLISPAREQMPAELPAGVRYVPWAPFERLLPGAAAIVHHGGIGTCARALQAGIPQVIVPQAHDQFDNADRLRKLGVSETIAAGALSEPRLVDALQRLLRSQTVRLKCCEYAGLLAAAGNAAAKCAAVAASLFADPDYGAPAAAWQNEGPEA
jgi:rhamnosyltransferase subunit B